MLPNKLQTSELTLCVLPQPTHTQELLSHCHLLFTLSTHSAHYFGKVSGWTGGKSLRTSSKLQKYKKYIYMTNRLFNDDETGIYFFL